MRELVDGVHMIEGLGQAYLYREADRLTLIDTGLKGKDAEILDLIGSLGRKPADLRQIVIDREVHDGDEVDVDGGARIVHVPGHTSGSIALYVPQRRLLFTGDAAARDLEGRLMVGVLNVDSARARESMRKLAGFDFEVACFGHGAPMNKEAALAFRRVVEKL